DVGDAVLGQSRCRAADRTEVEAAELGARSLDLRGPVALAEHDHRPAGFLKEAHIAVHPRRSGRPERPRRHVFGSLRRSRVVDGMILDIVGQPLTGAEAVAQFGVDDVAGDDHRPRQGEPITDGQARQLGLQFRHRPIEVDGGGVAGFDLLDPTHRGQKSCWIVFELLDEDTVCVDAAMICRSAEQLTAMAIGRDPLCRGRRTTRTSWQKYLPPNCAPKPRFWVSSKTVCSNSWSRKPCPVTALPVVGRSSREWALASLAVLSVNSAEGPPVTTARS